jgi:hypothetical protein
MSCSDLAGVIGRVLLILKQYELKWLLFAAIAGALILRLSTPSIIFFGPDQGLLQLMVDNYFSTGHLPLVGLVGTKGIHYGPLPVWFYIFLRSFKPEFLSIEHWLFYCIGLAQCAAFIYFLLGLKRVFKGDTFLLLSIYMLSLPTLIFYSRQLWDNPFLLIITNLAAGYFFRLFVGANPQRKHLMSMWLVGGALSAAAVSIHLFALPLVITILTACNYLGSPKSQSKIVGNVIFFLTAIVILMPYLVGVFSLDTLVNVTESKPFSATRWLTGLRSVLIQWSGWFTWSGILRYYGHDIPDHALTYFTWIPSVVRTSFIYVTLAFQSATGLLILWSTMQFKKIYVIGISGRNVSVLRFAMIMAVVHLSMAVVMDATTHVHYFQAVWWIPFLLLGFIYESISINMRVVFRTFILSMSLVNVVGCFLVGESISATRGFSVRPMDTLVDVYHEIAQKLCQSDQTAIKLSNKNDMIHVPALQWVAGTEDKCSGKSFESDSYSGGLFVRQTMLPTPQIEVTVVPPSKIE